MWPDRYKYHATHTSRSDGSEVMLIMEYSHTTALFMNEAGDTFTGSLSEWVRIPYRLTVDTPSEEMEGTRTPTVAERLWALAHASSALWADSFNAVRYNPELEQYHRGKAFAYEHAARMLEGTDAS